MPGPASSDPDSPVSVARGPGDVDPDAIQTQDDDGLPDDFWEFLEVSETEECEDCGSLLRPRFVEDGVCMGCRYGTHQGNDDHGGEAVAE